MQPFAYLQLLFFVSEVALLVLKRSKKAEGKSSRDSRSLLILWIVIALSLCAGPTVGAYGIWSFSNIDLWRGLGTAVCIVGFIIRWIAIIQLGRMFTVDVAITDDHTLKTGGLYKIVRHPSYLGLMLIITGLAICMNSALSILVMVIPIFLALNYRIKVEEKALTEEFGEQYDAYKEKVAKLIPGVY